MRKVAIFDIDNTLVNVNTTEDFIDFYLKKYNKLKYLLFLFYRFCLKDVLIVFKKNIRNINIFFLKNEPFNNIKNAAHEYVQTLKTYINPEIEKIINNYREKDYDLIFLSATIDVIVKELVNLLSFNNGRGSTLKYNNDNICLGEFEADILNNKVEVLKTLIKESIDYNNSIVLTDNREDDRLMKLFPKSIAVIHSKLEYNFWINEGVGTIFIAPYRPFKKHYLKYLFPLGYFFYTRGVPSFWIAFIINSTCLFHLLNLTYFHLLNGYNLIKYIISLLAFYSFYEIHYLLNDCHAFQEQFPTLRIDKFTCQNKNFIVSGKLLFFIAFLIILVFCFKVDIKFLVLSYIILHLIFSAHTNTSSTNLKRYLTDPFFELAHLIIPLLVFKIPFIFIICSFLLFGVIKSSQLYYLAKLDKNILNKKRRFYNVSLPIYIIYLLVLISFIIFKQPLLIYLLISGVYFVSEELIFTLKDLEYILSK